MSRNGLAMAEITPEGHHRAVAEPERIERILSAMSMWSMAPAPGAGADGPWKERATIHVEILAWANDVNAWTLRRRSGRGEPLRARPAALPRLPHARVLAFAGSAAREHVETVDYQLLITEEPPEYATRLHAEADALQDVMQLEIQHGRSRSKREKRRTGTVQSPQNPLFGRGPRPRPPNPPAG
jgi:hypothetical protein